MLTNEQIKDEVKALKKRGVLARTVAGEAGISEQYLSMLVQGRRPRPSAVVVDRLERAIAALKNGIASADKAA